MPKFIVTIEPIGGFLAETVTIRAGEETKANFINKFFGTSNISKDSPGFNNFDFSEFSKIFDVIKEIIADIS